MTDLIISPSKLQKLLESYPASTGFIIAFSGGMDSHALLHAICDLQDRIAIPVSAVHVNHRLSNHSADWACHCEEICKQLKIKLNIIIIDARHPKGESPEAWARQLRYKALVEKIDYNKVLFTAHHKDDQLETLLLQLLRGAGPRGLASMPESRTFGKGYLVRPFLQYDRKQIENYALTQGLKWIEDNTNQDTMYDRNYLRHRVLPILRARWPAIAATTSRVAQHQSEILALEDEISRMDLTSVLNTERNTLAISQLIKLSIPRQKNLIRRWIKSLKLPLPDSLHIKHILKDVISSKVDAQPCVSWKGAEVKRYRDELYALTPLKIHDKQQEFIWSLEQRLQVTHGELRASMEKEGGIRPGACPGKSLMIRYRRGGEVIRPRGRKNQHDLKTLMQEQGIPVWCRDRIPLLYIDSKLAIVPGLWIDEEFTSNACEEGWKITWTGMEELMPS